MGNVPVAIFFGTVGWEYMQKVENNNSENWIRQIISNLLTSRLTSKLYSYLYYYYCKQHQYHKYYYLDPEKYTCNIMKVKIK